MNKEAILEAIKEPLRLLVLALIPFALAYFSVIDTQWAIALTFLLRFADKLLHVVGKEVEEIGGESLLTKGLTRF